MSALILIVDETPLARTILRRTIERGGYRAAEAGCTREAIRVYLAARPDVVTMDILMEGRDGIVAIQALRHIDPSAKIIVCSATSDPAYVAAAAKLGSWGFSTSP